MFSLQVFFPFFIYQFCPYVFLFRVMTTTMQCRFLLCTYFVLEQLAIASPKIILQAVFGLNLQTQLSANHDLEFEGMLTMSIRISLISFRLLQCPRLSLTLYIGVSQQYCVIIELLICRLVNRIIHFSLIDRQESNSDPLIVFIVFVLFIFSL